MQREDLQRGGVGWHGERLKAARGTGRWGAGHRTLRLQVRLQVKSSASQQDENEPQVADPSYTTDLEALQK